MNVGRMLAAEAAAHSCSSDTDLGHRYAKLFRDALLNMVHRLASRVECDAPGRIDIGHTPVRLHVDVMLRLGFPDALHDRVTLAEGALHIAFLDRALEH